MDEATIIIMAICLVVLACIGIELIKDGLVEASKDEWLKKPKKKP